MRRQKMIGQHLKTFNFTKVLGEGAWATVYEAIDDRDKSTVAVKAIARSLMRETPKLEELVKTEIKVLKSCQNENVIRFIDTFKSESSIFIAMEYCNGGDLQKYLEKKKSLSEDEATMFLKQILNGFKGLHQVGAMHRDFKVANVLLHNRVCKIADLGFAKQMEKKALTKTILGTSLTMAPEVLQQRPYGFQADIWSIGVVYYQLLYGKYPYMGMNDYDILKKIKSTRPDYSKVQISDKARDFIDKCLTVDPKKRIRWQQIYDHPLLSKQEPNFLYGLKSRIDINDNKNFYNKKGLPEKNLYPDINEKGGTFDILGIQFEDIGDNIRESSNMNAILEEANYKREKERAFEEFEKAYLDRRNDIYFVFKFIAPFISKFGNIKANHGISMFMVSKKAYIDMKAFSKNLQKKDNVFKFKNFFEEFTMSSIYQNLIAQVKTDLEIIQVQCISYSSDIDICSKEIQAQFDVDNVASHNFLDLVKQQVEEYWFLLAQAMSSVIGNNKKDLIKVLQALYYYKSSSKTKVQEFDRMMTIIDFEEAEKDIMKKYTSIFN